MNRRAKSMGPVSKGCRDTLETQETTRPTTYVTRLFRRHFSQKTNVVVERLVVEQIIVEQIIERILIVERILIERILIERSLVGPVFFSPQFPVYAKVAVLSLLSFTRRCRSLVGFFSPQFPVYAKVAVLSLLSFTRRCRSLVGFFSPQFPVYAKVAVLSLLSFTRRGRPPQDSSGPSLFYQPAPSRAWSSAPIDRRSSVPSLFDPWEVL